MASDTASASMENGSYEIIRKRLHGDAKELKSRLDLLNLARREVFGGIETQLIANDRIHTSNNCIPRDMVALGHQFIFGYNVHVGLRAQLSLADVFSIYRFNPEDHSFHAEPISLIEDDKFEDEFQNLYKYYKHTVFSKFARIGPHLYMVFQVGKSVSDIKTFKWAIEGERLVYLGNRFDHEYSFPNQHDFQWRRCTRDMQRKGKHPHISIEERVFVETVDGDLTVKVEDNTDSGKGIYAEPVDHSEQTLDDAEFSYAILGHLIVLRIRPYQEKNYRYLIFNEKIKEVVRVDALEHACVFLPDEQGIIFSNGYYLQSGTHKIFDNLQAGMLYEKRIPSPNGEDVLFVFYSAQSGSYVLLPYNQVARQVATPIMCHGYSLFPDGELCYFRSEDEPGKHHVVQVWQTPYTEVEIRPETGNPYLLKVGNKDLVRGMAECHELLALIDKEEQYEGLYGDLVKFTTDILDSYYWIGQQEASNLAEPLNAIRESAASAIDEYEKVRRLRKQAKESLEEVSARRESLFDKIKRHKPKSIDQFVSYLSDLRGLQGELITLKSQRYMDISQLESIEEEVVSRRQQLSEKCVAFLLEAEALKPYHLKVAEEQKSVETIQKVAEAQLRSEAVDAISGELELLIDTVSNLKIEDATQSTQIINQISEIYGQLNQLRAQIKQKRKALRSTEAVAEFGAQFNLLQQGLVNYLELCDTPEKCDSSLTKLMVQVEEMEGKYADFEEFLPQLADLREEVYEAFESRKVQLIEARNKRSQHLLITAERILQGIQHKSLRFSELPELNAYFASDLMVEKVRDIIQQLRQSNEAVKADDLQGQLKTLYEDAIRQQKDKNDLYVEGEQVIRLGRHRFSTHTLDLDLTLMPRAGQMFYHLTGTNYFQPVESEELNETQDVWEQSLSSENSSVYRAEYLATQLLNLPELKKDKLAKEDLLARVQKYMAERYQEGYTKGIHDADAIQIFQALKEMKNEMGLLSYDPEARACAAVWWHSFIEEEARKLLEKRLASAGTLLKLFPDKKEFADLQEDIQERISAFVSEEKIFSEEMVIAASEFLFRVLSKGQAFPISPVAAEVYQAFTSYLKKKKFVSKFDDSVNALEGFPVDKYEMVRHWVSAFVHNAPFPVPQLHEQAYIQEVSALVFCDDFDPKKVRSLKLERELTGLRGEHAVIKEGNYHLDYLAFQKKLTHFEHTTRPLFESFLARKKELASKEKATLKLESFRPRVLSSFVRNQLIDQLYLPLIGDNLAKQIGTLGEQGRTDRNGMLLLISPPGYGKTTLMEYIAHRLGLIFMKINGPVIGHEVRSLDSGEAPNAAAREELEKLNLALEMGDNIMLYLDDIQHCHPEFLQKFISLCDAQRKIEGVYRGRSKTYDLRGKRVAVVMAGNPYTESGDKFQIPDMLSNRADTYNLGDIIGENADVFKWSYLENALTSNPILAPLATKPQADIYAIFSLAEKGSNAQPEFQSQISADELSEYVSVVKKLLKIRDIVLDVNQAYIYSAAQEDAFRTEPVFQLQGSYRNMNQLAEKVVPIMNEEELNSLILSHYEQESQTLTTGAEANLLKFKMMTGFASEKDQKRWEEIVTLYQRNKLMSGDRLGQLVQQMGAFSEGLQHIRAVLEKGINGK